MDFVIGFIAGIGTNILSWWILSHFIVPKIEFSPSISKLPSPTTETDCSGFRYRIKLRNGGMRGIIDIEITAILRIEGITNKSNIELITIPLVPEGEKHANIIKLPRRRPGEKTA